MNIMVTGGAGFIGSHVADVFINEGHRVIIVDNLITGKRENINKKAEFYEIDICDPRIEDIFRDNEIDILCHHAAQMDVRKSVADPLFDANTNILGTINLLENCRKYKVSKIIFSSTGGVIYGEPDPAFLPVSEEYPTRPQCAYGVSKLCCEHYIQYYSDLFGLDYSIFRYGNVYGPRQDPHGEAGVVAIFSGLLLDRKPCKIFGTGNATRDYIHISDICKANLMALTKGSRVILNLGTGIETSVNQLYELMREIVGVDMEPEYAPERPGEINRIAINITKAKEVLGWSPLVELKDGLKDTIEYFAKQRQLTC